MGVVGWAFIIFCSGTLLIPIVKVVGFTMVHLLLILVVEESADGDGVFDFPKVEAIVFGGSSTKVTFLFVPVEVVVFTMVHHFLISAVAESADEILEFLKVDVVYVVFGFRGRRREAGKQWHS